MEENLSLYGFKFLPDEEQYYITFNKGKFLDYYLEENKGFALYAISQFFVEIEYDAPNNKIIGKTSFVSGDKLNRYSNISNQT